MYKTVSLIISLVFIFNSTQNGYQDLIDSDKSRLSNLIIFLRNHSKNNFSVTTDTAKAALEIASRIDDQKAKGEIFFHLGQINSLHANHDSASQYLSDALKLLKATQHTEYIAHCLNRIGIEKKYKDDFSGAIYSFNEALEIAKKDTNNRLIGSILINIGNLHRQLDDYEVAMEYLLGGLKYYLLTGWTEGVAWTEFSIGALYKKLGKLKKAAEYVESASEKYSLISDQNDNNSGKAICQAQLGIIYSEMGDLDKALRYAKTALKIREEQNIKSIIATENSRVGKIYFLMANYKLAEQHLRNAYNSLKDSNEKAGLATVAKNYALLLKAMGEHKSALKFLNEAKQVTFVKQLKSIRQELYFIYYEIYEEIGNTRESFKFYKLYSELGDTLNKERTSNQVLLLQTQKELESKSEQNRILLQQNKIQELQLHSSDQVKYLLAAITLMALLLLITIYFKLRDKTRANKEISQQRERLIKLNSDKDKLFSLISHDLKNPFNPLLGMSKALSDNFDSLSKDDLKDGLSTVHESARKVFLLLENLLLWSEVQIDKIMVENKSLKLKELVTEIAEVYKHELSRKQINLLNEIEPSLIIQSDSNILGTVLRNIINNGIKFTQTGGEIKISNEIIQNHLNISIKDNGIGMSEEELSSLFVEAGDKKRKKFHKESGSGLGLIICKEYIQRINGQIMVESSPGKGSTFIIKLLNSDLERVLYKEDFS